MRLVCLVALMVAQVGLAQPTAAPSLGDIAADKLRQVLQQLAAADENAEVMDSTFKLTCDAASGTGFVMAQPKDSGPELQYFLISANHVFLACSAHHNDLMKIGFRKRRENDPFRWDIQERSIKIAHGGKPLWMQAPDSKDVGVIAIEVPNGIIGKPLTTGTLADANTLRTLLYVGRNVFTLGFPFGQPELPGQPAMSGFPILKSAQIASRVMDRKNVIVLSMQIYPGDSGGPVYTVQQRPEGLQFILLGLMVQAVVHKTDVVHGDGVRPDVWIMPGIGYVTASTDIAGAIELWNAHREQ
jgi:hypothetical protein